MKRPALLLSLLCALVAAPPVLADARADVEAATARWIEAFNRRDAGAISALYAPDAVFLGTSSPVLRDSPALVRDYFDGLARLPPDARQSVGEHRVQLLGPDAAVSSGYYTLVRTEQGRRVESPARFTFVYQRRDGRWLIVTHHSSVLPATP
jgi:uncharacterized protein (TIGR02246 family)